MASDKVQFFLEQVVDYYIFVFRPLSRNMSLSKIYFLITINKAKAIVCTRQWPFETYRIWNKSTMNQIYAYGYHMMIVLEDNREYCPVDTRTLQQ